MLSLTLHMSGICGNGSLHIPGKSVNFCSQYMGPGRKPGTVIGSVSKITFTLLRRNYCWPYYAIFPKKIISVTLLPISSFLGEIFKFSRLSELPFSLNPPNRLSKSLPDSASRQLYARRRGFGRRGLVWQRLFHR